MGDGVRCFHGLIEGAGDVAHHRQAKEGPKENADHHGADRQGPQIAVARGGGVVFILGLAELQLQQCVHVFPQRGVGGAHLVVVELLGRFDVPGLQRRHGGLEAVVHELVAVGCKLVRQPFLVRSQLGGDIGGPKLVVFNQILVDFCGCTLHFFGREIGEGIGQREAVFQQVGLDLRQLTQGHGTVFVHGAQAFFGLVCAIEAYASHDEQQDGHQADEQHQAG